MLRCRGFFFLTLVLFVNPLSTGRSGNREDNNPVYDGKHASEWVQMLGSADSARRSRAESVLVVIGAPAVPQLLAGLKGKNERIRIATANTLGQLSKTPKSVLAALIDALNDPSEEVRYAVGLAICQNVSAKSSGEEANKAAAPALFKARENKDRRVRKLASCALARILRDKASPSLVDGLIEAIKDREREVQEQALDALESAGPAAKSALPVLQDLLKPRIDIEIRFKAVMAIAAIDPKSKTTIGLLIKVLQENGPNARERLAGKEGLYYSMAAEKLGLIGPLAKEGIEPLSQALRDPDRNVRVYAAVALRRIAPEKTREMVRLLIEFLKHEDSFVRVNAVGALGEIGPMAIEAVTPLTDLIRREKESFVREGAVDALKRIDPASSAKQKQR